MFKHWSDLSLALARTWTGYEYAPKKSATVRQGAVACSCTAERARCSVSECLFVKRGVLSRRDKAGKSVLKKKKCFMHGAQPCSESLNPNRVLVQVLDLFSWLSRPGQVKKCLPYQDFATHGPLSLYFGLDFSM